MTTSFQPLLFLVRAWVLAVAVTATLGWVFAAAGMTRFVGPVAVVLLVGLAVWRRRMLTSAIVSEGRALLRFWPLALLLGVMAVLAFSYNVSVHDTLTYRLPRIRLWMQDGGLQWYDVNDSRINSLGRNWEWLGMAILQVGRSERLLVLPSLVSWILLTRIFFKWSGEFMGEGWAARAAGLVLASSPLLVVQGITTMNDLLAIGLVACSAVLLLAGWKADEESRGWNYLVFSGLALAVATGVKPNLGTLAVVWCAGLIPWWVRREKKFALPWPLLAAVIPLGVIASGLPTLIMNHVHTGSPMGRMNVGEESVAPTSALGGALIGHLMFWWQSAQPVFNPLAGLINSVTSGWDAQLSQIAPRFHLKTDFFRFGESATMGPLTTVCIVVGGLLATGRREADRSLLLWVAVGAVVAMTLNFALAIPYELGRSSAAFLVPIVPLALFGLGLLRGKWARLLPVAAVLSLASTFLHLMLEPNRSLLPANVKASLVERFGGQKGARVAESFRDYRTRRFSGRELYQQVPPGAGSLGIYLDQHTPTAAAWRYLPKNTKVVFYGTADPETLAAAPESYFLLVGDEEIVRPVLDRPEQFELVETRPYLIRLQEGERPWHLVKKVASPQER